jgi:hypothetical protein
MSRNNILVAVVARLDTREKTTIGDRGLLENDYVLRTFFDDLSTDEISAYLDGQLLPRVTQQGKVCGIICKPNDDTVVGLYSHDDRRGIERYHSSKKLDAELRDLWTTEM